MANIIHTSIIPGYSGSINDLPEWILSITEESPVEHIHATNEWDEYERLNPDAPLNVLTPPPKADSLSVINLEDDRTIEVRYDGQVREVYTQDVQKLKPHIAPGLYTYITWRGGVENNGIVTKIEDLTDGAKNFLKAIKVLPDSTREAAKNWYGIQINDAAITTVSKVDLQGYNSKVDSDILGAPLRVNNIKD